MFEVSFEKYSDWTGLAIVDNKDVSIMRWLTYLEGNTVATSYRPVPWGEYTSHMAGKPSAESGGGGVKRTSINDVEHLGYKPRRVSARATTTSADSTDSGSSSSTSLKEGRSTSAAINLT